MLAEEQGTPLGISKSAMISSHEKIINSKRTDGNHRNPKSRQLVRSFLELQLLPRPNLDLEELLSGVRVRSSAEISLQRPQMINYHPSPTLQTMQTCIVQIITT